MSDKYNDKNDGQSRPDDLGARIEALSKASGHKEKRSVRLREQDASSPADVPPQSFGGRVRYNISQAFQDLRHFTKTQRFRRGGSAAVLTVLFIVFVVLMNLIAMSLTSKYAFLSPDLTKNQIYTLSDVTKDLLANLNERVEIDILASEVNCMNTSVDFDPYSQVPMATGLIKRYEQMSEYIKVEFIDLTQYPGYLDLVPDYRDVLYEYCIVVRSQRRTRATSFYEMLPSLSGTTMTDSASIDIESSLTEMYISSLIKTVTIDTVPTAIYLDSLGGGEYIDYLTDALELNGYDLNTGYDFTFGYDPIPEDAQMVIISAPAYDLTQSQLSALSDFLENGGKLGKTLLVLSSNLSPDLPNLKTLLEEWGLGYTRDTVYEGDPSRVLPTMTSDIFKAQCMQSEYIDENISSRDIPVADALEIKIPRRTYDNGIVINPILTSSAQSYAIPSGERFDASAQSPAEAAERVIMASATMYRDSSGGGQLRSDIIITPCSMCSAEYFGSSVYGNFNLMMNVCNLRCGIVYENLNIESKSLTPADFAVDSDILRVLTVIFGYIIPLAIAVGGAVVYFRRRRL